LYSAVHVSGHGDNVIVAELDQRVTAGIGWPDAADQRGVDGNRIAGLELDELAEFNAHDVPHEIGSCHRDFGRAQSV
jgi:hypothetical protein